MPRKKLKRLKEVKSLTNVFDIELKDTEQKLREFFCNKNPFILEIGCGRADYSIELAQLKPDKNFIAVDYKGARIYLGAKRAIELKLKNIAFLLAGAEKLAQIFISEKIEEIYIPFPDPYNSRKSFKRLIDKNFLKIYNTIVGNNAKVHLKTDNEEVFNHAISILSEKKYKIYCATSNLYSEPNLEPHQEIKTKYEKLYLTEGRDIKYICFGI